MPEQLRLLDDERPRPFDTEGDIVIRESRRARSLILQMLPPYTLEVVVPRGTRPGAVREFLAANQRWIDKARSELRLHYPAERIAPPTEIFLAAVDRRWRVDYATNRGEIARLRATAETLTIEAADRTSRDVQQLLRRWLMTQARHYLKPWIAREALRVGIAPKAVQVRTQRTRWGSCSPKGNISLNASLLFVDADAVRYLLIHELCHLIHLNHSRRYWKAVARFEPDYKTLDKRLAEAWSSVPVWALAR